MSEQTGYVYFGGGLSAAERDTALTSLDAAGALTAVIQHTPTRIQFQSWRPAELAEQGRAFGPEWEVRWQKGAENGRYDLLIIGEQPRPELAAPRWTCSEMNVDPPERIYLWGDHWRSLRGAGDGAPDGWVQAQITADLRYPVQNGGSDRPHVRVTARNYRQGGIVRFTRFATLRVAQTQEATHGQ